MKDMCFYVLIREFIGADKFRVDGGVGMGNSYEQGFIERINQIYDNGYAKISEIETFPFQAAQQVLKEIIETGCLSQNISNIILARELIKKIPADWLMLYLPAIIKVTLFLDQEWQYWEFQRMSEMIEADFPEVNRWFLSYVKGLNNPEIDEEIS